MSGLWFLIIAILFVITVIIAIKFDDDDLVFIPVIIGIIMCIFILTIPSGRKNSKTDVIKLEVFITQSEQSTKTVFFSDVDEWNGKIVDWHEKSQKWYQNKWWIHPSARDLEYLK